MPFDTLSMPSAFTPNEPPPQRWYAWPDDCVLSSVPCDGYIWEPSPEDPRIYIAVGLAPPKPEFVAEDPPQRTALYRAFDESNRLLYVGISGTPEKRWVHHSENKSWWPEVAQIAVEWRDSRAEASHEEAKAIRSEKPVHNVQHNSKGRRKVQ